MVAAGQEHVRGLDVAVHEARGVSGVERGGDLGDDEGRALGAERALVADERAQVVAVDVAHRQVEDAVLLARRVDRDHVRVVDRRGGLGLAHEAQPEALVLGQRGRDDLQRDDAVEGRLMRPVDDPHAAPARDAVDAKARELGSWFQRFHRSVF